MNKVWAGMKGKIFYLALGVGLIAFVALISVYSYNQNVDSLEEDRAVDLNAPAVESADGSETGDDMGSDTDELAGATDAARADAGEDGENGESIASGEADGENDGEDSQTGDSLTADTSGTDEDDASQSGAGDGLTADAAEAEDSDTSQSGAGDSLTADASDNSIFYPAEEDGETVDVISGSAEADTENSLVAGLEYNGESYLIWPVSGDVIMPYSMETTVFYRTLMSYKCSPGMLIAGEVGDQVQAAYEGVVESITTDNEYGTVVTVNMGNGYRTIYGQLQNVTVSEGDMISTAEKIGEISTPTNYYTLEGAHVFFEMTKDGEPVNPVNYMQ